MVTKEFVVAGPWQLAWAYDCGDDDNGNLTIATSGGDTIPPINPVGRKGQGTEQYELDGRFQLDIRSQCPWAVKVVS